MRLKTIISLSLIWLIIALGVFLRGFKIDVYPVDNNDDGLHYTWAGLSFWQNPLKPTTHSIFETDNPNLIWRSQFKDYLPLERFGMKIVRPWLDHPPLGAAIIALPAKLLGYRGFEPIPQAIVRLAALLASIFTLYLTYALAKTLFAKRVAYFSLLFLATVPYFVIAHRQSFLENLLTPLFLAALVFLQKNNLWGMILTSFFCGWIKIPGFAVPLMLAIWLKIKAKTKTSWQLLATGVISFLSYLGYSLVVDKAGFGRMLFNQGTRGAFVNSFLDALTNPEFYGAFRDGWYVLGFIFSLTLVLKYQQEKFKFFSWFFSSWLIVLFLISGRLSNSPWYRYPLIPFMAMALGYYADRFLKSKTLFLALPFWLLGLTGFDLLGIELSSTWLRLATIGFFTVYGLRLMFKHSFFTKLASLTSKLFLIFLLLLNIYVSLRYSTIHCLKQERCLAPFKIIVQP